MSNINKINAIPFEDILSQLGIRYKLKGDVIMVIGEDGNITDWWRGSISKGFLKCHSWKKPWRIEGDRISLIMDYLNTTEERKAFEWYEGTFNIDKKTFKKQPKNNIMKERWEWLPDISPEMVAYLWERNVNSLSSVKNLDGRIAMAICSENGNIIGIQWRGITTDKKDRYRIEGEWKGLFLNNYNPQKKELFILEGMTDSLTAEGLLSSSIGLVSAGTDVNMLKAFHKKHTLIVIPDKDAAGDGMLTKMEEAGIVFGTYDLHSFAEDIKDFNDLVGHIKELGGDVMDVENIILSSAVLPLSNLQLALRKARQLKNSGTILTGDDTFDYMTWWLWRGKTMLINWPSGQGKTTLSLNIMRNLLLNQKDKKVFYYSLETDVWTQLCQILAFLEGKSVEFIMNNIDFYEKKLWELSNLEIYDDIRSFDEITQHIQANSPDVAFIDFAQKCRIEGANEKEKMINYAQRMQDFAISNWHVSIISLSQTAMGNYMTPILQRTPKDSWALFESSDTTINVGRDENWKWVVAFLKTKNIWAKGWYKVCDTSYDPATWEYFIFKPDETTSAPIKKRI